MQGPGDENGQTREHPLLPWLHELVVFLLAMFLETDKDQNGKITKSEFRTFLLNRLDVSLEADMVAEVLGHYDKDGTFDKIVKYVNDK